MCSRFFAIPFAVRLAVTLWAVLIVSVGVRVAVSKPTSQSVMPIYLHAGERWLRGERLYEPVLGEDVYRNPPVMAAGFAALGMLPETLGGLLVRGVGVALFLTGLGRVRRAFLADWSPARVGWLFTLAVLPAIPSFNNGQLNLLLAAGALHGVAAARRGREWEAAAWLGVIGWVKVYPLAVGLLVTLRTRWPFAAKLAATVALGGAIPFALADRATVERDYADYVKYLGEDDRTDAHISRVPRDWTTLPRAWLGVVPPAKLAHAVSLAVAAGFAGLVWWRVGEPLLLTLTLAQVWMTAFGPATEANTYSLLAAVAPLVLLTPGRPRWALVMAGAGYALLAGTVLAGMFPGDDMVHVQGPQALGAILLAVASLSRTGNDRRP